MKDQSRVTNQRAKNNILLLLTTVTISTIVFGQSSSGVAKTELTTGRLESIFISMLGLASLIMSIRSFRSSKKGISINRRGSIIAASAGVLCIVLASIHIANSTGGFGTGSGKAGAIVAIVLGLIGIILSGLALSRVRHAG